MAATPLSAEAITAALQAIAAVAAPAAPAAAAADATDADATDAAASTDVTDEPAAEQPQLDLVVKWGREVVEVRIPADSTVGSFKQKLQEQTGVLAKRQKLIGVMHKGKIAGDEIALGDAKLGKKLMLIGTREERIVHEPAPEDMPDVFNDLDVDYSAPESAVEAETVRSPANLKQLDQRVKDIEVTVINPPRPGKKLLVFDLDYTLYDCGKESRKATEALDISKAMEILKRPFCDELLAACYEKYEIVIWSATHWKWVEMKLTDLGLLTHPKYKIMSVVDRSSMFPLKLPAGSKKKGHEVKPLEFIWAKLPAFSAANTVHIDDLSRNFAMNPQSGLKVSAFKHAPAKRAEDMELLALMQYLLNIAEVDDFRTLDHVKWHKSEYAKADPR